MFEILKLIPVGDSEVWNLIKICVQLVIWTQPSGPLCLWQCFLYKFYLFFWKWTWGEWKMCLVYSIFVLNCIELQKWPVNWIWRDLFRSKWVVDKWIKDNFRNPIKQPLALTFLMLAKRRRIHEDVKAMTKHIFGTSQRIIYNKFLQSQYLALTIG